MVICTCRPRVIWPDVPAAPCRVHYPEPETKEVEPDGPRVH